MTRGHDADPIPGLDGDERQAAARRLWEAWRGDGCGAAVLTGMSGVGKTRAVVGPLVGRAARAGVPTASIDVPVDAADMDAVLVSRLAEELEDGGHAELAASIAHHADFTSAAREVLRHGALIVVDEFQRMLDSGGQLRQSRARTVERLAKRPPDGGCLWLVSNRWVDADWTESFHVEELPIPDGEDATRIVLKGLTAQDADVRFPVARRVEVIRRLGANPRVLRLLGFLLKKHSLDDLLPPTAVLPRAPFRMQLVEDIERQLLAKAAEGLSDETRAFLRNLSVLRDWAPWPLVEAIGGGTVDLETRVDELLERYLLDARAPEGQSGSGPRTRYQVHPLVREVDGVRMQRDGEAWREAHRRAGEWYARPLYEAARVRTRDLVLAEALDHARFHLTEAGAQDVLADAMRSVHEYVERRFNWSSPQPSTDRERDARIALLKIYLAQADVPATHFHLAKLLRGLGGRDDLVEALRHAERSTVGEDRADPWVLWVQLVRVVEGLDAATAAAREAVAHVAPAKNLFNAYQLLGLYLRDRGRIGEAIEVLKEGMERAEDNQHRLAETAVRYAAGEPTAEPLEDVRDWLRRKNGLEVQASFAEALLMERRGQWREAAEFVGRISAELPTYLSPALHEVMCWLGAGETDRARTALAKISPAHNRTGNSLIWLAATVALLEDDLPRASQLLGAFLETPAPPTTADGIRAALLYDWDHRLGQFGEASPALVYAVLPPTVTGLPTDVIRPQYGGPVLPQHQKASAAPMPDDRIRFLALATEWSSAHGGLSTFNRQLCSALAAAGAQVLCVVLDASPQEHQDAAARGVTLVEARVMPGVSGVQRLFLKPELPDGAEPHFVIGHGRITGPAAQNLGDAFPHARRLHFIHMIPDEIERLKLDRGVDIGALAEERQEIELGLGAGAHRTVVVGPRMYNWFLRDLEARGVEGRRILRFDPGFDAETTDVRTPPSGAPWMTLLFGRAEDHYLKGLDLAARAFALARQSRPVGATAVELLVRGAPERTSGQLEASMRDWAQDPALPVRVRPYSTVHERLAADLRSASLVLMPSRGEGFGLVGVEAIAAGTPVLVSSASGLGELLSRKLLAPDDAARIVVETTRDDARDVAAWSDAIKAVLRDREGAFSWASKLRSDLAGRWTWSDAVSGLLAELDDPAG
ncbi:glycosyltransferase [Streptomyces sp. NPDC048751]|uniref:glycosyltransferase n=1 Tax=Streptomyces sp. NPDC048751 TaxID=3365591 RepID=UPI0037218DC0